MHAVVLAQESGVVHAVVHEAWWEWVLAFVPVAGFVLYELLGHRSNMTDSQTRRRALWTWVASLVTGAGFGGFIWLRHGTLAMQEYNAGWLVEYSLSFDNVAVWQQLLMAFGVLAVFRPKLVMYGVLMAIVLRLVFIYLGATFLLKFTLVLVLAGIFLIYTAIKLVGGHDDESHKRPQDGWFYRLLTRVLPYAPGDHGGDLLTKREGRGWLFGLKITSLGICVLFFAFYDMLFALDSIPAVYGLTHDTFLIATSNLNAMLGLMSLYTVFDSIKNKITKLNEGLAIILVFVGCKLILGVPEVWDYALNRIQIADYPLYAFIGVVVLVAVGVFFARRRWFTKWFAITCAFMVGIALLLALKPAHGHELHVGPEISLPVIIGTLLGAYVWGRVFPEKPKSTTLAA